MIIKIRNKSIDVGNPIKNISGIQIDLRKSLEWEQNGILSNEGETARLYLEMLEDNIDLETISFDDVIDYLNVPPRKQSESMKETCRKTLSIRFPRKFKNEINLVSPHLKNEYMLIEQEENTIKSLGQCGGGVLGKVRLDGTTDRIPRRVNY